MRHLQSGVVQHTVLVPMQEYLHGGGQVLRKPADADFASVLQHFFFQDRGHCVTTFLHHREHTKIVRQLRNDEKMRGQENGNKTLDEGPVSKCGFGGGLQSHLR